SRACSAAATASSYWCWLYSCRARASGSSAARDGAAAAVMNARARIVRSIFAIVAHRKTWLKWLDVNGLAGGRYRFGTMRLDGPAEDRAARGASALAQGH